QLGGSEAPRGRAAQVEHRLVGGVARGHRGGEVVGAAGGEGVDEVGPGASTRSVGVADEADGGAARAPAAVAAVGERENFGRGAGLAVAAGAGVGRGAGAEGQREAVARRGGGEVVAVY